MLTLPAQDGPPQGQPGLTCTVTLGQAGTLPCGSKQGVLQGARWMTPASKALACIGPTGIALTSRSGSVSAREPGGWKKVTLTLLLFAGLQPFAHLGQGTLEGPQAVA